MDAADADDVFLKNYLSQKTWRAQDVQPIAHPDMSDDEDELDRMDAFEAKFNFRYQDPDAALIVTHARDQDTSMRKKDTSRKEARDRKKLQQAENKKAKDEELKRLKNLKKTDILAKLKTISTITGNTNVGFNEIDLEGDFDPGASNWMRPRLALSCV